MSKDTNIKLLNDSQLFYVTAGSREITESEAIGGTAEKAPEKYVRCKCCGEVYKSGSLGTFMVTHSGYCIGCEMISGSDERKWCKNLLTSTFFKM